MFILNVFLYVYRNRMFKLWIIIYKGIVYNEEYVGVRLFFLCGWNDVKLYGIIKVFFEKYL